MRPLVSVITPTFDAAGFVAETVDSVLGQSYETVEHVLVDDASSDRTPEVLRDLQARYPGRVRVLLADERAGPCRRRNDALASARGELIAWLDHDDLFASGKLEAQVEALSSAPDAGFAFSQYEEFDDGSETTTFRSSLRAGEDLLERLFVEGCFIASSSVVFRRSALERRALKLREAHFSFGDDYYLWLTLLLDGRGILVDEPLVRLRRHGRNESARIATTNYHSLRIALLQDFLNEQPDARARLGGEVVAKGLAHHAIAEASWEFDRGRRARALRAALRAASYDPRGAARFVRRVATAGPRRLLR